MTLGARRLVARGLLIATPVLLIAAALAAYATRVVFDSDRFANRAAAALQAPSVRAVIADRVTDEVVLEAQADLVAARPIIASAVSGLVGSDAFAGLFRRGARDVHRAVFRRDEDTVTLTLVDVGIVLKTALQVLDPELASEIDAGERYEVLRRDLGGAGGDLVRLARDVRVLAWILAALAVAAAAAAVGLSADRRRTASRLGLAVVAAGVVLVAGEQIARWLVLERVDEPAERAAAGAVWDAFLGDLRTVGWLIAAAGAVVSAAAASLLQPVPVERSLRSAWRIVSTEPRSGALRVVRGAALAAAGVLVIARPLGVLRIVVLVAGVYLLYKGLEAILRAINPPAEPAPRRAPGRRGPRRAAVGVLAVLLIGVAAGTVVASGGVDAPEPPIARCNGHAALCDRPLDEVTLASTHNSMSVPLPGWFASLQERPIGDQLEDGIRGLLFDSHYADRLPNGRTRTYFANPEELRRSIQQDGVSEEAVQAALRLRARAGFRGEGERGMYLCHTFCELGATPLASVLDDIHGFLVTHPGEVLAVINQDFVTPADFVGALDAAGLSDLRLRAAAQRTVADVARADRARPAAGGAGRERGRRGALVPARL